MNGTMEMDVDSTMMPPTIYYALPPMPWFGMDIGGTLSKLGIISNKMSKITVFGLKHFKYKFDQFFKRNKIMKKFKIFQQ